MTVLPQLRDELTAAADRQVVEAGAQGLWNLCRKEQMGRRLPPSLGDAPADVRAQLREDATVALGAPTAQDGARALFALRVPDVAPGHVREGAQRWWVRRARVARGEEAIEVVPQVSALQEERDRMPRPDGNAICRKCKRPMRWVRHATTGRAFPVDPDPTPGYGNVLTDGNGRATVYGTHELAMAAREGDIANGGAMGITSAPLTSHHASCPVVLAEREAAAEKKRAEAREAAGGEQMGLGL